MHLLYVHLQSDRSAKMFDRVGQQLGNYKIIHLIGRGGFAEVYLGEHLYLKNLAAIKVLYTRLAKDDMERFLAEARMLVRLTHPHIVRVLDFGVQEDIPFLVMDYAPHGTLRQRHPRGSLLPLPLIVQYVKQIADGLQFAHDARLIHRDIKPENMLLGRQDEILLSDFGIAITVLSSHMQSTRDMAGTITYMAPEQIQAHPRPASDQYALGVVVYEWLSGRPPFQGSFTEVAAKHALAPPPPLYTVVPGISREVEYVVMTALQKDPAKRFGSMRAFANAFEQACQADPTYISSPHTGMPPHPTRGEMYTPSAPVSIIPASPREFMQTPPGPPPVLSFPQTGAIPFTQPANPLNPSPAIPGSSPLFRTEAI